MTKENKLALVVGFALILLVGILVSDHFSAARNQESADLRPANDPLVDAKWTQPDLLPIAPPTEDQGSDGAKGFLSGSLEPTPQQSTLPPVDPGLDAPREQPQPLPVPLPREERARFHDVRQGESLTSISELYFKSDKFVRAIAELNNLDDPDMLQAGVRLRLPPLAGDVEAGPSKPERNDRPKKKGPSSTYTVRTGDVLTLIAQRELGSARHWQRLYEMNRNVINDPDHLEVGTVLRLPQHREG